MKPIQVRIGQAAYLTRGLDDGWSPAHGRLDILHAPPKAPLETTEVIPPEERGAWGHPVITLHDDARSLLTELLPYRVVSPAAESDATPLPAGALVLGAARNPAALKALSRTLGVDLENPDFGYALVRLVREDGEVSHASHEGELLVYSRPKLPAAYGLTKDFHSAMSRLAWVDMEVPNGWRGRYDLAAIRDTLGFQRTFGTHYVSKVAVGDTLFQVLAYPSVQFARVKKAYARNPGRLSGPGAADFVYYTTDLGAGEHGFVREFGELLNLSHCDAFQRTLAEGKWREPTWSGRNSLFALFAPQSPLTLRTLDEHFRDQAPTRVTLASMGVLIEHKRGVYWQRVLKAAMAQKYQDSIDVDVRAGDTRDFQKMLPEDLPGLVSTLATPTINVYCGRLDLGQMQLVAAEEVKDFTLLTHVLSSHAKVPVRVPGRSVRLFAQIVDVRAPKGVATWTLADDAFHGAEIACHEFLGGLVLRNEARTAYAFVLDGMKFGLTGAGRDAEPDVVADLRSRPSDKALPSLAWTQKLAMSFLEAVLGHQGWDPGADLSDPAAGLRELARAGCEWFAGFVPPSTTDADLLALRVQALGLARLARDPTQGAFVPLLPPERYEAHVAKILDQVGAIGREIQVQEQKIALRRQSELIIDVGRTLNQNIVQSGKLLRGLIDASRAQQEDLAGHFDGIIAQLDAEAKVESARADQLEGELFKAEGEVKNGILGYREAVKAQVISDQVKFGLDVATQIFDLSAVILLPATSISAVEKLGKAAQRIQKVLQIAKAISDLHATGSKEVEVLQRASKTLGAEQWDSMSTLPWDELFSAFKRVMAEGPKGEIVERVLPALEAAFETLVLRGKAVVEARSNLSRVHREISANRWQKELSVRQAKRLASLDTALEPARIEDLDRQAIDLVGLTGDLHAIQTQILAKLSRAFLLQDQALQYANLQPPTPVSSIHLLSFLSARGRQESAKLEALQALARLQAVTTTPIPYVVEGVRVEDLCRGARFQIPIGADAKELFRYVHARVVAVVAEVQGVTSTESGRVLVQLDFEGASFTDRDPKRNPLHFHTPGRSRAYEYKAETGERLFQDEGKSWSDDVSRVTPFATWTVSLPDTATNRGIRFAGDRVRVRLVFVLQARVVDVPLAARGHLAMSGGAMESLQEAAPPPLAALVAQMRSQGSCTNGWDVVFNMGLAQINKALDQQYKELLEDSRFKNTIGVETRTHVQGSIWAIKKYVIHYGFPRLELLANNGDTVKLRMQILADSTIQSCSEVSGVVTCDPPASVGGQTMDANVTLSKVAGTVAGKEVLAVRLEMAKGAFTISNINLSNEEQVELNKALKAYFVSNPVTFLINQLDLTTVPTLDSLKPNGFLFKTIKTPSGVEMLQLFIQTHTRPLKDASQAFLNNVPEPLPDGKQCSMMIRSQLFFEEILPRSLQTNGWTMKGVAATTANGAWTGALTSAAVRGNVDLASLADESIVIIPKVGTKRTRWTYAIKGGNPITFSLVDSTLESTPEGAMILKGKKKTSLAFIETKVVDFFSTETTTSEHLTEVEVGLRVTLPVEVSGAGREQKIRIVTTSKAVSIEARLGGGGPCGSSDLQAQVNNQINGQVPPQIEGALNVSFDSISVFALKNLLFPKDNFIHFTEALTPGDVLLVGNFL